VVVDQIEIEGVTAIEAQLPATVRLQWPVGSPVDAWMRHPGNAAAASFSGALDRFALQLSCLRMDGSMLQEGGPRWDSLRSMLVEPGRWDRRSAWTGG
jgi:hypothetical protein